MSEKPNPCNLKLVLLFDPQDQSCSVYSHNLTIEDASKKLDELVYMQRTTQMTARRVGRNSHGFSP